MPMLAVTRPDADGSFCAREPRHPDVSMARSATQRPAAERRLAAQEEGWLRGGVEGKMQSELRRQCCDGQWRRRLGSGRYRGDGEKLGLVRMEPAGCRQCDPGMAKHSVRQIRRGAHAPRRTVEH